MPHSSEAPASSGASETAEKEATPARRLAATNDELVSRLRRRRAELTVRDMWITPWEIF